MRPGPRHVAEQTCALAVFSAAVVHCHSHYTMVCDVGIPCWTCVRQVLYWSQGLAKPCNERPAVPFRLV